MEERHRRLNRPLREEVRPGVVEVGLLRFPCCCARSHCIEP